MKKAWPVLPAALLVGTALYATIASMKAESLPPDRWVEAWKAAGFESHLRSTGGRLMLTGERDRLEEPPYRGTTIREYYVQSIFTQLVELPSDGLFEDIPGGRHRDFRPGKKGRKVNLCRKGRLLLLVYPRVYAIGASPKPVPASTLRRIFDAFEEAAGP